MHSFAFMVPKLNHSKPRISLTRPYSTVLAVWH